MNWKTLAKRTNSLPEGWSTADAIATDLDCEPSEVPKILASAIRDGLVEKQNFPTWQPGSRQLLYQTGYRQRPQATPAAQPTTKPTGDPIADAVRRCAARHPDYSPSKLRDNLPKSMRRLITAAEINAILGR